MNDVQPHIRTLRAARSHLRYIWRERRSVAAVPYIFLLRRRARRRLKADAPGCSVLIATWQTRPFLERMLPLVLDRSPETVEVIVVDNASTDGSDQVLSGFAGRVRVVRSPFNMGHGAALDVAALQASREVIVALDVDAFPISHSWLDELIEPLRSGQYTVSGAAASNGQIAPCLLAMHRRRFVERRHSFRGHILPGVNPATDPTKYWDAGRGISVKEGKARLYGIPRIGYLDEERGIGEIFGAVAYHNGYSTVDRLGIDRGSATKEAALHTWSRALEEFGNV